MRAKERHRQVLLDFLSNPDNGFPSRSVLSVEVLKFKQTQQLYKIFTLEELSEIEQQALAFRRSKYAAYMAKVDLALLRKAATGDAQAAKLAYHRFEGWSEKKAANVTCVGNHSIQVGFVAGAPTPGV